MIKENLLSENRTFSINLDELTYRKIEHHASQNGEDISRCIASAISEAVDLWDDYDKIIGTLNLRETLPLF